MPIGYEYEAFWAAVPVGQSDNLSLIWSNKDYE